MALTIKRKRKTKTKGKEKRKYFFFGLKKKTIKNTEKQRTQTPIQIDTEGFSISLFAYYREIE